MCDGMMMSRSVVIFARKSERNELLRTFRGSSRELQNAQAVFLSFLLVLSLKLGAPWSSQIAALIYLASAYL